MLVTDPAAQALRQAPVPLIFNVSQTSKAKRLDHEAVIPIFNDMATMLPIAKMSTEDKLRAMEDLWTSLTADDSRFPLPAWHKAELRETEKRVVSGEEEFIDWEDAKKSLRRRAK